MQDEVLAILTDIRHGMKRQEVAQVQADMNMNDMKQLWPLENHVIRKLHMLLSYFEDELSSKNKSNFVSIRV